MAPRCVHCTSPPDLRARQLPHATGGAVFGVARPPRTRQNDRTVQLRISYAYNRGAVITRLRVRSLRLSFGADLRGGAQGALRGYVSHYYFKISNCCGSMLKLVGNPQVYMYVPLP